MGEPVENTGTCQLQQTGLCDHNGRMGTNMKTVNLIGMPTQCAIIEMSLLYGELLGKIYWRNKHMCMIEMSD